MRPSPLVGYFRAHEPDRMKRLLITPGDPATEIVAACFMAKLNAFLEDDESGLRCVEVVVEETSTNTVAFSGDPFEVLPGRPMVGNRPSWWRRADSSANDFDDEVRP